MTVARAASPAADIRHIVFDFGAVVLQWKPTDVVKRHFPERCPDAAAAQAFARAVFAHGDWQQFDAGLADAPTTGARLAARLELDVQRVHDMVHCIDDHLQPIASSVALIESLHERRSQGWAMGLHFLSNMPAPYARGIEARHAFMRHFDSGVFSGDVGLAKPDLAIYQLAQRRMGAAHGHQILFLDDHADNVAAAAQRGWNTLHVTDVSRLAQQVFCYLGL